MSDGTVTLDDIARVIKRLRIDALRAEIAGGWLGNDPHCSPAAPRARPRPDGRAIWWPRRGRR